MRILLILFLLALPLAAQERSDRLGEVTTAAIPDKPRWPAAERGMSYRVEALRFVRDETVTVQFRRGTGEGTEFVPTADPAVTMTVNLRGTCSGESGVTFTINGTTKCYASQGDQRRLRQATRDIFAHWSEVLPEFFQPDRMVRP